MVARALISVANSQNYLKELPMKIIASGLIVPLILLGGCVTTATAEQRVSCEEMERAMTTGTTHDHAGQKTTALNSMNLTHDQCRRILAQKN